MAMLAEMKKKSVGRPPKPPESIAATTHVRMRTVYHGLLQDLARRNKRTITGELEIAIEDYLAKNGLWPPAEGDAE